MPIWVPVVALVAALILVVLLTEVAGVEPVVAAWVGIVAVSSCVVILLLDAWLPPQLRGPASPSGPTGPVPRTGPANARTCSDRVAAGRKTHLSRTSTSPPLARRPSRS